MSNNISYLEFREKLLPQGCFSIYQVQAFFPDFNRNNLLRWTEKNYLVKLRRGWYAFSELLKNPDYSRYVANRIYRPSYISLHTALSIYGMIPEAVANITSVTTQKTLNFQNAFGNYFYYTVKPDLFFGFKPVMLPSRNSEINSPQQTWLLAHPEKALLDLLYLYPFYNNEEEIEQLRLDEDFLQTGLDLNQLNEYLKLFDNKSLNRKIKILEKIYDL